jgi:hypothetical protein
VYLLKIVPEFPKLANGSEVNPAFCWESKLAANGSLANWSVKYINQHLNSGIHQSLPFPNALSLDSKPEFATGPLEDAKGSAD